MRLEREKKRVKTTSILKTGPSKTKNKNKIYHVQNQIVLLHIEKMKQNGTGASDDDY